MSKLKEMAERFSKQEKSTTAKETNTKAANTTKKVAIEAKKELINDVGNPFINAAAENTLLDTKTLNGMPAMSTTMDACLDLFSSFGAMRGKDILPLFTKAYLENPELALRITLWGRDAREGAGERQLFRNIIKTISQFKGSKESDLDKAVICKIPEIGRFDDLLELLSTPFKDIAIGIIQNALEQENGLCAKWMPREGKEAYILRKAFGLNAKEWRKLLVGLTDVVETKMCEQEWAKIDYNKVPSVAFSRYTRAFKKHSPNEFDAFMAKVETGEAKINAGAIYPYQIIDSLSHGNEKEAEAQWNALPNWVSPQSILPIVDTSGSMMWNNGITPTPMDIAISLGIYIADKNKSVWKDTIMLFSENPRLFKIHGNLVDKVRTFCKNREDARNTNLNKTIDLILQTGITNKVSNSDMPKTLLIISDMQFDQSPVAIKESSLQMIKRKYVEAGYDFPKVIYWNVKDYGNKPAHANEKGVGIISGFSPAIMKNVIEGKDFSPKTLMLEAVMKERYDL